MVQAIQEAGVRAQQSSLFSVSGVAARRQRRLCLRRVAVRRHGLPNGILLARCEKVEQLDTLTSSLRLRLRH